VFDFEWRSIPLDSEAQVMKIQAVCFDMDGTLIRNTDSVRFLCTINGNSEAFEEIEELESDGRVRWDEADYLKVPLTKGLSVAKVEAGFESDVELVQNIEQVLTHLKGRGVKSVIITSGPVQVARIIGTRFGFDCVYGSLYEEKNGYLTGRLTSHVGADGKIRCLEDFCRKNGIGLEQCVAIGDSGSDIKVFEACGRSIAVNYTDAVKGKASEYIVTDDLSDLIDILDSWIGE
jgi:phosphoserine phosphatase